MTLLQQNSVADSLSTQSSGSAAADSAAAAAMAMAKAYCTKFAVMLRSCLWNLALYQMLSGFPEVVQSRTAGSARRRSPNDYSV
jgi:hypothetical protein